MRETVLDAKALVHGVALVVLMGPEVDVSEDMAEAAMTAARTRTVYSTLVAKGRLTVQYRTAHNGLYRVTLDA